MGNEAVEWPSACDGAVTDGASAGGHVDPCRRVLASHRLYLPPSPKSPHPEPTAYLRAIATTLPIGAKSAQVLSPVSLTSRKGGCRLASGGAGMTRRSCRTSLTIWRSRSFSRIAS